MPFCILDRDEFPLGVAEGSEWTTEDCAGVDVDGVVAPKRCFDWGVPVDYRCLAVVVCGPVEADGQTLIIELAVGFSIEAE